VILGHGVAGWTLLTFLSRVLRSVVVVAVARKQQASEHNKDTGHNQQPAATTTNEQHPASFGWLKPKLHFGSLCRPSARPRLLSLGQRGVYVTALPIR